MSCRFAIFLILKLGILRSSARSQDSGDTAACRLAAVGVSVDPWVPVHRAQPGGRDAVPVSSFSRKAACEAYKMIGFQYFCRAGDDRFADRMRGEIHT